MMQRETRLTEFSERARREKYERHIGAAGGEGYKAGSNMPQCRKKWVPGMPRRRHTTSKHLPACQLALGTWQLPVCAEFSQRHVLRTTEEAGRTDAARGIGHAEAQGHLGWRLRRRGTAFRLSPTRTAMRYRLSSLSSVDNVKPRMNKFDFTTGDGRGLTGAQGQ